MTANTECRPLTPMTLLTALREFDFPALARDPYWWPDSGRLEVVVGALLTQQTRWEQVEQALARLGGAGLMTVEALAGAAPEQLAKRIQGCAFHNIKGRRLSRLARAMQRDFGDFQHFQRAVTRDWLLAQSGIGPETADSILNYACYRPVMVVDAYSHRLMSSLGRSFDNDYAALQNWFHQGIEARIEAGNRARVYAEFHGRIVCYCKDHGRRGGAIDIDDLANVWPG